MVAVLEPGLELLSQRLEPRQPVQLAHGVIDGKPEQHFPGLIGFSMLPITAAMTPVDSAIGSMAEPASARSSAARLRITNRLPSTSDESTRWLTEH